MKKTINREIKEFEKKNLTKRQKILAAEWPLHADWLTFIGYK